jgi:hypothetical protein
MDFDSMLKWCGERNHGEENLAQKHNVWDGWFAFFTKITSQVAPYRPIYKFPPFARKNSKALVQKRF